MRNIKDEHNLNKKKVLLRLDLNVPLSNGKITDTTRIDKILPTINFLLKNNAQIIILSHIGRPKGKIINELSLKPVCESLKNKLNQDIRLISKNIKEVKSEDLFDIYLPLIRHEQQFGIGLAVRKEVLKKMGIISSSKTRSPGPSLDKDDMMELENLLKRLKKNLSEKDIPLPIGI